MCCSAAMPHAVTCATCRRTVPLEAWYRAGAWEGTLGSAANAGWQRLLRWLGIPVIYCSERCYILAMGHHQPRRAVRPATAPPSALLRRMRSWWKAGAAAGPAEVGRAAVTRMAAGSLPLDRATEWYYPAVVARPSGDGWRAGASGSLVDQGPRAGIVESSRGGLSREIAPDLSARDTVRTRVAR